MPLPQLNRPLVSFAALLLFSLPAMAANPLQIKTDKGKVEGAYTADQQVIAFKGIPYAAPPVGDLRWKPPMPAAKWKGVRPAKEFGSHCVQTGGYPDMVFHDPGPSEDCLTLNVWTPASAKPDSHLPVMVWIYGGGFTTGGTSEKRQDGQYLAHRNVIIVSMNYRLGIFGFFVHPELTAESPHHASGNYGLMDQAAALEWVKRNIAAFGGDPSNITIFGESAGSFAVSTLMASPLTKGLISKAIGESGGAFYSGGLGYQPREVLEQRNVEFARTAFGTSQLADLRKLSADDLVKAAMAKTDPRPPRFGPDIDGYFLPDSVPDIYAAGKQAHVPLLAGWNADEGSFFATRGMTAVQWKAMAEGLFKDRSAEFLKLYPGDTDAQALRSAIDFGSDSFIAFGTWKWLEAQRKTGGDSPVYRYHFELAALPSKYHPGTFAFHSDDIEYVFGTLDTRPGETVRAEDRELSEAMMGYWSNFAKTGDPNGSGLPTWPKYGADNSLIHLNSPITSGPDTTRARYEFLLGGIPPMHF